MMPQKPQRPKETPVYARSLEGITETMIPVGPYESVNESSARTLGLLREAKPE